MNVDDVLKANFDDSLVDVTLTEESGYPAECAAEDTVEQFRMLGAEDFPDKLWIEPKEWKSRVAELVNAKVDCESRRNRFTNQSPTHECTCHSLVQGCEAAWNATREGKGSPVYFSPLSVYAEANPGQWGGAGCVQVLRIAMRRGLLPDNHGPGGANDQKNRFKVTLHGTTGRGNATQDHGPWVKLRNFPDGWENTARHFRPREIIILSGRDAPEQAVSLLLHSRVVNVGRSGHAVPWNLPTWRGGNDSDPFKGLYVAYPDSYDVVRYDSWSTVRNAASGGSCIWQMTVPDDWDKPAGEDMK